MPTQEVAEHAQAGRSDTTPRRSRTRRARDLPSPPRDRPASASALDAKRRQPLVRRRWQPPNVAMQPVGAHHARGAASAHPTPPAGQYARFDVTDGQRPRPTLAVNPKASCKIVGNWWRWDHKRDSATRRLRTRRGTQSARWVILFNSITFDFHYTNYGGPHCGGLSHDPASSNVPASGRRLHCQHARHCLPEAWSCPLNLILCHHVRLAPPSSSTPT